MKNRLSISLSLAVALALLVTAVVMADNLNNDVASNGIVTITAGDSTTITYQLVGNNSPQGDPKGCDATSAKPVTVSITKSDAVSGPSSFSFEGCGPDYRVEVAFSSGTAGEYNITHSISGGVSDSKFNNNADFILKVNAVTPTNHYPTLTLPDDITAEATSADGAEVTFEVAAFDEEDGALTPTCEPASGSTFPLDTTQVDCSVTDSDGATTSGIFNVTVQDTTPPDVTVPDNLTVEAAGSDGAAVTFDVSAYDLVDGALTPTCDYASGATFALDVTTTVTCTVTDAHDNEGSASFTVTVQDTTPPDITVPADITAEATGPSGAAVTFSASASDLVDGALTPTCDYASGATFALDVTTTVTCTATDAHGNEGSASFTVTVQDTTPPDVTVPADITAEATGPSGAAVTFSASASDLVDGALTPTCVPASGSTFALDVTTMVTCSATDAHDNTASANFNVTVIDTTPPAIDSHADVGPIEATGPSGAVVTYASPATHDLVDGDGSATCAPVSGSVFALGETTVTCNAKDAHNNEAQPTYFKVTVVDTMPPTLTVPGNMTIPATSPAGAVATFSATATDLVDPSPVVTCEPPSGSTFAPGKTLVSCTATDASNNTSAPKTFQIWVTYQLKGFYQPVDMNGVFNLVKGGSTVPLKFEIFAGATELTDVAYIKSFVQTRIACDGSSSTDEIEFTTTGGTFLRYDPVAGQFIQNWQTPKLPGACYRVTMTAQDGSSLVAFFKLK